jgi:hypothetical protein
LIDKAKNLAAPDLLCPTIEATQNETIFSTLIPFLSRMGLAILTGFLEKSNGQFRLIYEFSQQLVQRCSCETAQEHQ